MIKKQCYVLLIFVAVLYLDAVAAQQKFRIANIQPITGKFNSIVVPMVNAMHLWEKNTNARGGFLINGQNYTVEVVDIDVGSKIDAEFNNKTINETQNVVGGVYGEIHVVFAPYSSDLTPISALVSEAAGMPSIAGNI
jgi:ABC-type branched-subunit amino acid transport system substrate-binding protein